MIRAEILVVGRVRGENIAYALQRYAEDLHCKLVVLSLADTEKLILESDHREIEYKACVVAVNPFRYANPLETINQCSKIVSKITAENYIYIDTMRYGKKADYYQSLKKKLGDSIQAVKPVISLKIPFFESDQLIEEHRKQEKPASRSLLTYFTTKDALHNALTNHSSTLVTIPLAITDQHLSRTGFIVLQFLEYIWTRETKSITTHRFKKLVERIMLVVFRLPKISLVYLVREK